MLSIHDLILMSQNVISPMPANECLDNLPSITKSLFLYHPYWSSFARNVCMIALLFCEALFRTFISSINKKHGSVLLAKRNKFSEEIYVNFFRKGYKDTAFEPVTFEKLFLFYLYGSQNLTGSIKSEISIFQC